MNNLLSNVNIQQIIIFLTVVEQKGFAKAALYLHMTQSAVSKSIARLESELEFELFTRTTRELSLTEVGEFLFANWKPQLSQMQDIYQKALDMNSKNIKSLHIAISNTTLPTKYFWPVAEIFTEKYNDVEVNVDSDYMTTLYEKLTDRIYDIIFIPDFENYSFDDKIVDWKWAAKNNMQVLVPLDNPLSEKAVLTIDDLRNESFVIVEEKTENYLRSLHDFFEKANIAPKIGKPYKNAYSIKSAYKTNQELLLTDDYFDLGDNAYYKKIPLEGYYNGILCVWNKKMRTPYIKKFIDLLPSFDV